MIRRSLIAYYGDHHRALAAAHIALKVKDLLPPAQHWLAFCDRHGQRWTKQSSLQMRVSVAVVPGLFVSVTAAGRDEFVENLWQVALESRLKFDGANHSGAADVEDVHGAGSNARIGDDHGDLLG